MAEIMLAAPIVGRTPNAVARRAALTVCDIVSDAGHARELLIQLGLVQLDTDGQVHPVGGEIADGDHLWDGSRASDHVYTTARR